MRKIEPAATTSREWRVWATAAAAEPRSAKERALLDEAGEVELVEAVQGPPPAFVWAGDVERAEAKVAR